MVFDAPEQLSYEDPARGDDGDSNKHFVRLKGVPRNGDEIAEPGIRSVEFSHNYAHQRVAQP